jgi:hypothetical protein
MTEPVFNLRARISAVARVRQARAIAALGQRMSEEPRGGDARDHTAEGDFNANLRKLVNGSEGA